MPTVYNTVKIPIKTSGSSQKSKDVNVKYFLTWYGGVDKTFYHVTVKSSYYTHVWQGQSLLVGDIILYGHFTALKSLLLYLIVTDRLVCDNFLRNPSITQVNLVSRIDFAFIPYVHKDGKQNQNLLSCTVSLWLYRYCCFLQLIFGKSCQRFLENSASPFWRILPMPPAP